MFFLSIEHASSLPTAPGCCQFPPSVRLSRLVSIPPRPADGKFDGTAGILGHGYRLSAALVRCRPGLEHTSFSQRCRRASEVSMCVHVDRWMSFVFTLKVSLYPCVATPGRARQGSEEHPRGGQPVARCRLCDDPLHPAVSLLCPRTDSRRHVGYLHARPRE